MARSDGAETLDSWLNKATDPSNVEDRWDCVQEFYQLVNQQTDGPQVATRLLGHKIQSPQENEALQALNILEACMNHCGRRFHVEAGKFRFLNELIKVLLPKYQGRWSSEQVKQRVTEVLYGWTLRLKENAKIQEAYRLLKKQGLVKKDPTLEDRIAIPPPSSRRSTASVFDQQDKAELLARLLRSTRPDDLRTANALIQNTIREEQEKAERESKRTSTLEEVEACVSQLRGMLDRSDAAGGLATPSEEMTVLYERCAKLRPSLFRLASETTEDDAALARVLAANDELTLAVTGYRQRVGENEGEKTRRGETSEEENTVNAPPTSPRGVRSYRLIDLSALDAPLLSITLPPPPSPSGTGSHLAGVDLELIDLGSDDSLTSTHQTLNTYSKDLLLVSRGLQRSEGDASGGRDLSGGTQDVSPSPGTLQGSGPRSQHLTAAPVPMETPRTSQLGPVTLYHRAGVHVSLHSARDPPGGPPDEAAMVLSAINTSALPVRDFLFQAAVPKGMSVRLQPSSDSHLPPFNPLLPPAALSQKLSLSNPQKLKVRLRYKLAFLHGDQPLSEAGEIGSFPPWTSSADVSD